MRKGREPRTAAATENEAVRGRAHHHVYVVFLRNPKGDGRAGYYVGMTGLTPEERFANHKAGRKAASVVRRFGERLVPKLYEHLNPMSYEAAVRMERELAEQLRERGFQVFGGT
jgi:predicted GIY-YIG superfamily endonuclease